MKSNIVLQNLRNAKAVWRFLTREMKIKIMSNILKLYKL